MRALTYIRIGFALPVFAGAIFYGMLLTLFGVEAESVKNAVARLMAGPVLRLVRLRVRISGDERLDGVGPGVLVGNQQSVLCYCVYAALFQKVPNSGIVARLTGKWNIPLVTLLFRRTKNFMVDPRNPLRTAVGFVAARRFLMEEGGRIWMGPEGTRWKEPGVLGPFKPGAFRLAIEAQVPVIPMVISPLKPKTDLSVPRLDPQEVELRILNPISTEGMTLEDVRTLQESVRTLMQEAYGQVAEERRSSP